MCAKNGRGGLQEEGGFPIYFFIFERGWLIQNSVKIYWGDLQEGARLTTSITACLFLPKLICFFSVNVV